jgi:hypothetical protein
MSVSHINYRENYFQHPSLTRISGDPTYTSLAKLEKECKANGKSVSSTLGGGQQGHLGLVCNALAYNRVSPDVPFVRPLLPVLPDLTASTAPQIAEARQAYADRLAAFQACNLIERTIIQQINTALDADCLADLIDDDTGLLEGTIPEILQSLFDTYGDITPQSLTAAKAKVEGTTYNHSRPIVNLFTDINEYANMADAAHAAETTEQLINIGIIIITRSTIFASDIRKWHAKPDADKTWPLFKEHFRAAQKEIKRSQPAVTTDSLGFHGQANTASSIVDQVVDRLSAQQLSDTTTTTMSTADNIAEQQMDQQLVNMANSTQQNQQMLQQMTALASTVSSLQSQLQQQPASQGTHYSQGNRQGQGNHYGRGGGGRGRQQHHRPGRGGRGPRLQQPRQPFQYCWTHGNCGHAGGTCETAADGHVATATYANMQGGSTRNCHWLNA